MITIYDNDKIMMQPGKTLVSVAVLKEYASGTPVFVKCYRASNTWTLPHTMVDYTDTDHTTSVMLDVIEELDLDSFDIISSEPIIDVVDEDMPSRIIIYLAKAGLGIDAYQMYPTPKDSKYRLSRFMHQNQLFSMHKSILLDLYVRYLRSK